MKKFLGLFLGNVDGITERHTLKQPADNDDSL